jgi:tetraacyldisaccharide 4'-kinase
VGNLSFGGRGKTPLVAHLAKMLVSAGERPAILTRGYARRRREDGVVVVSDGTRILADVDRAGDEPLMLARDLPGACVLVSEQRALAGAVAERALGATVHLLDDGFQHLALARDIDIVIVTTGDFTQRAMPFGRLREPAAALTWADAVLEEGNAPDRRDGRLSFTFQRVIGDPVPLEAERGWSSPDRRVVALAGIAEPARFTRALSAAGWSVVDALPFADHHRYRTPDLARLAAAATRAQAPVLTTAKDAMRLLPLRPLPAAVAYIPLTVTVQPEITFRTWLFDRLREARA